MITGMLEPTTGRVLLDGQDIRSDIAAFKRRLGYVPEEPHLYSYLTGLEYLQLIGRLWLLPTGVVDQKANRSAESAGAASAPACADFSLLKGDEAKGFDRGGASA